MKFDMARRVWTKEELAHLREMWPTTKTISQIAEEMGRSRKALIGKAAELKIFPPSKPWPDAHDEFVRENYPTEMDVKYICEVVKRSSWCIHAKARQLSVSRPKMKKLPHWASKFIRKNQDTMSIEELAKQTDLSIPRVKNILLARARYENSVSYYEDLLRDIGNLRGNEEKIAKLYRGKRYENIKLRRRK